MKRAVALVVAAGLALCLQAAFAGPSADFFVSPRGNDAWSGTLPAPNGIGTDGPFASLDRARLAVRGNRAGDITVLLRGGRYVLTNTVVFSRADSAQPGHTITYGAYPGENPILSSAVAISNWRKPEEPPAGLPAAARAHVWVADVRKHPAMRAVSDGRSPRFFTLYDGGRLLRRARGKGFSQLNKTPRGTQDWRTVQFPAGAIPSCITLDGAELRVIPSFFWIMNLLPVASIDCATGLLTTGQDGTYPLGKSGMTDRPTAWLENVVEVLDEPGEWVLQPGKGQLLYWPEDGAPGTDVAAPTLTELVRVEGDIDYDGPTDKPVTGIVFRGLTFTQGDSYPWHGRTGWGLQHDWECFDKPTALLRLRGAEKCSIEDCTFTASGRSAIRLDLHCQHNVVTGNHIHDIGGVGVLLSGYGPGTKDVNRDNEVTDNYIHDIGRIYWGSAAVFVWQSGHNRVAHNLIHEVPYNGINVTGRIHRDSPGPNECTRTVRESELPATFRKSNWQMRKAYLHARNNRIEFNDIHHVMKRLGDGNCIYVSGAGGGNVVARNFCHDSDGKYMNAVIRCDDDQYETLITHNVCTRTRGHGEGFISKGDNDIINNVVADLRQNHRHRGYVVFPYGSIRGARIERNILYACREDQNLYWEKTQAGGRHPGQCLLRDTAADRNLYWNSVDHEWGGRHLVAQRAHGIEGNSLAGDPLFMDMAGDDYRFAATSPAHKLGIEPIDISRCGLTPETRQRMLGSKLRTRIHARGGKLAEPTRIRIESEPPGAEIRYTLDGSAPDGTSRLYEGPFLLSTAAPVRARSFSDSGTDTVGASVYFTPPPAPIVATFESAPVGGGPLMAELHEDSKLKQFSVRVTDACASEGQRSLRFVDGPGQAASYTPHVVYRCRFDEGRLVGTFDAQVDADSFLSYQWRHYSQSYTQGPSVTVRPGGRLEHGSRRLLDIPIGQWVGFEVSCDAGDQANGTFDLCVILPGGTRRTFPGLKCSGAFRRLDWVGFISKSEINSTFYIDNVRVGPASK